jgi:hypothetical protein
MHNQARLDLSVLACNPGNLPLWAVRHRTLTPLREKLIMIEAKIARYSQKIVSRIAELAVTGELYRAIQKAIEWLQFSGAPFGRKSLLDRINIFC